MIPILIYAYEFGPDPGYCGVPGENGICAQLGCHVGTVNSGQGSVTVALPNGQTYAPGVKQHLMVTISDPATTQQAWGFQLTARSSTNTQSEAGSFVPSDANTQLLCAPDPGRDCLGGSGDPLRRRQRFRLELGVGTSGCDSGGKPTKGISDVERCQSEAGNFIDIVGNHRLCAHHSDTPPFPATMPVTARGVSAAKVVATIEVPASHQGTLRPERKDSLVLRPARDL